LIEVSQRIKAELRLSDTMGRFGGEEFVAILINANLQEGVIVAERIRKSIADKPFRLTTTGYCEASISIGVATLSSTTNHGEIDKVARDLLFEADRALYFAKNQGRNRVCVAPKENAEN